MSSRSLGLDEPTWAWMIGQTVREHPVLAELREQTAALPKARMQISPEQGAFMGFLVRTLGVRRAVEVGVFTGYSALAVALALPEDGELFGIDVNAEWTGIGRAAWDRAGVGHKVRLDLSGGTAGLASLRARLGPGCLDFGFIDADKEGYPAYYEAILDLLRPGGVVAIDNTLWSGRVADPSVQDSETRAIRAVVERAFADGRVDACLVPIGDGLVLARKR